jgi:hypothetical protein
MMRLYLFAACGEKVVSSWHEWQCVDRGGFRLDGARACGDGARSNDE